MFGHATYGSEWIPFEWGWDLLTYLIFSVSGIEGIQIFRSLIFSLIFLIIYLTLKKLKVNSILSISMLILLLISIIDRLTPRPHIITYLFLSILLYILVCNRYSDREKNMKLLYFLPIIFLLWCNFHMGVLVGGLLLFLFTLSETLTFKNKKLYKGTSDINYRYIRRLWIVSAICFFTLFLNPHGYYTYIYTYNHSNLKLLSTITEWKSPFSSGFEFTLTITLYKILLLAGIVVLIHSFIKKDIFTGILFIALALHSFRAVRFMTDYEIIMIVFITSSLNYFLLKKQHLINLFTGKTAKALTTVILLIFIILLSTGKFYEILGYYRPMGFGIDKNFFPYDMIEFIKANNIRGKPYHHMAIGGYLIWNIPDEKNYIDSRNLNDEIYNEYLTVFYMKSGFEVIMNKREIDYVLYYDPDMDRRPESLKKNIVSYLSNNTDWRVIYWDDVSIVFVKNINKFRDVIEKYDYKILKPYDFIFNQRKFINNMIENREIAEKELKRKTDTEPDGWFTGIVREVFTKYVTGK